MRKKLGIGIAAFTAVTAFAFVGAACADNTNNGDAQTYVVTLNASGGSFSNGSDTLKKTVEKGGYVSDAETPTRDSFVFYGWLKNEDDVVTVNLSNTAINENTTFYAGWKQAVNITFYYNYDGAPNGGVYKTEALASGSLITEPTAPVRADYSLDCWTTDEAGDNVWSFAADRATKNIDLYAQWTEGSGEEQTTHTVTLNIDGMEYTQSVKDGSAFTRPADDPEKDGHKFIEWRVGSLDGEEYDFDTPVTTDIALYAYFEEVYESYTVTLHIGNDTEEHSVRENRKFAQPDDPQKDGFAFVEWRVGSLDGDAYDFDTLVTQDIDLYAYFLDESAVHSVSYVLDDGVSTVAVNASGNPSRFVEGKAVTLKSPSRPCYTFDGWYTDAEFTDKVTEISDDQTSDLTLYAKWSYNYPFFVTGVQTNWAGYTELKGSSNADKKESNAFYPLIVGEGAERTWDGKTFVANRVQLESGPVATHSYKIINSTTWFGVNGSTAGDAANMVADTNGRYTVTIVANANFTTISKIEHKLRKFTVSFDTGESNITFEPIEYKDGGYVDEPTITGCTVSAWYKDAEKTQPWDFDNDAVTEDITLYAGEITADEYNVTYPVNPNLTWNRAVEKVAFGGTLDLSFVLNEAYSKSEVVIKINGTVVEGDTYAVTSTGEIEITVSGIVKNKYTVSFFEKDGTKISDVIVEHGKNATAPTAATLIGEKFTGWSGSLTNITDDVELTAVYSYIDYKVSFESNGGTKVNAITNAHYGDKLNAPEGVEKKDCVLDGWFTDPDFTTEWDFGENTMPAKNITLYAKWSEDESVVWYTVTFNLYDGGAKYTSVKVSESGAVEKPADPPRDGYVFDGKWYTVDGDEYEFGEPPTADITLYAGWTLDVPEVALGGVSDEYTEDGYTLTAVASHAVDGVTYTYKWYKDGELLAGETGDTLTVKNVSDSGEYKVVVTANDGELTSDEAEATATVEIEKAKLAEVSAIAFKDGDAYSNKIVFEADETPFADGFIINVRDGENNVVETGEITIDEREYSVTSALVGAYTVEITYKLADGVEANVQNATAKKSVAFKGAGTAECPFVVATSGDLKNVGKYGAAHFVQTADITGITQSASLFASTDMFTGVYDGGGFTVDQVTSATGLFGYIGTGGTVKNITVNVKINSDASYIGGLAAVNNGNVLNVTVTGSIISTAKGHNDDKQKTELGTGGVVGKNRAGGVIDGCTNKATVRGEITVGGIVGYNMAEATVTGCTNDGALGTASTNMSWAGGLVGLNGGTVSQSVNTATLKAPTGSGNGNGNNYLSGLVAENIAGGIVSECVNSGAIDGDYAAAGLVSKNSGTVEYCINSGNVSARWSASGGTCLDTGAINKCIMTGTVSTSGGGDNTPVHNTGTATDCYYKNGSESGSKKYDVSTTEKAIAILEALGDKFVYDGTNIVLAYDKTACVVTFKVNDEIYLALNVASGVEIDLTKITAPTAPENYEFGGWIGADGDKITVDGDIELTATFNKKQYTVSFDANGGSKVENITDDYDAELTAPTSRKRGYTLAGWYTDDDKLFDFTAERSGNVNLTAKWTANDYTVTFDANGGSITTANKTIKFDGKYGELPVPTRSGYKFLGWFETLGTDGDDGSWGEQITAATDYTTAGDVTVYAKWEEVSKKIVLDYNYDGSPASHEIGVADGENETAINVISRDGYTLMGFATEADGEVAYTTTLTAVQFGELADEDGAVTLYAVWQVNIYTITVNLAGGEWEIETLTYTVEDLDENGNLDISALVPTRACRTFTGWTITRAGVGEVENIDLSDDYTITANWSEPEHTEETLEAKEATCTETGLTEGKVCSVCGEVLVAQEVVPTIPHNYEDGECTECGKQELKLTFVEVDGGYEVTGISAVTEANIVIPSEYEGQPVVSVAANAFNDDKDYSMVKSIVVPRSVKTIGASAFNGCQNIESITLPFAGYEEGFSQQNKKRYFGYIFGAPESYSGTTHINAIPSSLKTVIIAEGCKTIQNSAFRSSSGTSFGFTLVIPESVTTVESNNKFLKTIYYSGAETSTVLTNLKASGATEYYYSEEPNYDGAHWGYVDGVPTKWEI